MTVRQRNKLIGLAAAFVGLAGVAVLAAGLGVPVQVAADESAAPAEPVVAPVAPSDASAEQKDAESHVALSELQRLCRIDLRKPLFDVPALPSTAGAASNPSSASSLGARLVGTVVELGHSMAMFQKRDGSIELCAEGQSLDDAGGKITVLRIEYMKATVQVAGRMFNLVIPPLPGQQVSP
jgi:hypothetical protein